jgi:hypothetical protein
MEENIRLSSASGLRVELRNDISTNTITLTGTTGEESDQMPLDFFNQFLNAKNPGSILFTQINTGNSTAVIIFMKLD